MDRDIHRVKPNPRIVALMNYVIDEISPQLRGKEEFSGWLDWAASWKRGTRSPQGCVDVSHQCFKHEGEPVWHCLGQLAWGAKEACYDTSKSGWLVVRYIADAMIAFGIAFPAGGLMLDAPTIEGDLVQELAQLEN